MPDQLDANGERTVCALGPLPLTRRKQTPHTCSVSCLTHSAHFGLGLFVPVT
jgi:hypothetical protein